MILLEKCLQQYFHEKGSNYSKVLISDEFVEDLNVLLENYFFPKTFTLPEYFKNKVGESVYRKNEEDVTWINSDAINHIRHLNLLTESEFDRYYVESTEEEFNEARDRLFNSL